MLLLYLADCNKYEKFAMVNTLSSNIVNVNAIEDVFGTALDETFQLNAISSGNPHATLDGAGGYNTLDARNVFIGYSTMNFRDELINGVNGFTVGDFEAINFHEIYGNSTYNNSFLLQYVNHALVLHGGSGDDRFTASFGEQGIWTADVFYGYGGNDTFNLRPTDIAYGGAGNDIFDLSGTSGDLTGSAAHGGSGTDTLELSFGWTVDLSLEFADSPYSGSLDRYAVTSIENVEVSAWHGYFSSVIGSNDNNVLSVDEQFNDGSVGVSFSGLGGDDTLLGSAGDDALDGGAGNDLLEGGKGGDTIIGGSGADTVNAGTGWDMVSGGGQSDFLRGQGGRDTMLGGGGNDTLVGGAANDSLDGGPGDDSLNGGGGRDILIGGKGNDVLDGKGNNDTLDGGAGQDILTGGVGGGSDTFRFGDAADSGPEANTRDIITDFQVNNDILDLSGIDAIAGGDDNAFSFIESLSFSSTAGELRYQAAGANTYLQGDIDGDGVADFEIQLAGVLSLSAIDLIL